MRVQIKGQSDTQRIIASLHNALEQIGVPKDFPLYEVNLYITFKGDGVPENHQEHHVFEAPPGQKKPKKKKGPARKSHLSEFWDEVDRAAEQSGMDLWIEEQMEEARKDEAPAPVK